MSCICGHVCGHLMNEIAIFALFLLYFWSPPTPEGNIHPSSCQMHHHVYQPVSDWVCLLFGAEQVVHSGFLDLFMLKTTLWERTKTVQLQLNNEPNLAIKLRKVEVADWVHNCLYVHQYVQPLPHCPPRATSHTRPTNAVAAKPLSVL